jgi:regulator of protease activity HflC (stomatin/prohibitin superfamily)
MSWQIWVAMFFGVIALIGVAIRVFAAENDVKSFGVWVVIIAGGLGLLIIITGCFTIVGTRQIAVQTSFGRPEGMAFNNGLHGKMPWTITHEMDGSVQIDQYKDQGNNNDQRIQVRLGNSSTAHADVSIRWQMKQEYGPELFQQYKTFNNVRTNLVERNLAVALNEVFAGFDPLAPQNLDLSPLPDLQRKAADILRNMSDQGGHKISDELDIIDVNIPTIGYDQGTEDKINQLNQQRAATSIATESQKTADAQALANEKIAGSISHDPNVITQNCMNATIAKGISPMGCWPMNAQPVVPVH